MYKIPAKIPNQTPIFAISIHDQKTRAVTIPIATITPRKTKKGTITCLKKLTPATLHSV